MSFSSSLRCDATPALPDLRPSYCSYEELQKGEVDYVAGGATQNSARVAQVRSKNRATTQFARASNLVTVSSSQTIATGAPEGEGHCVLLRLHR